MAHHQAYLAEEQYFCNNENSFGFMSLREYFTSSTDWTQIQTQTIRKPRTCFCRLSEQKNQGWKNLRKLKNTVKTFIIQKFPYECFSQLLIRMLLRAFGTKTCDALVWEIKHSMRVIKRVACSGWWHIFRLAADMIKNTVKNGRINPCSCGTFIYWTMNVFIS